MNSATWFQIQNEAVWISFCVYADEKGMNPFLLSSFGYILGQTILFNLITATTLENENSWFQWAVLCLETDLLHPVRAREGYINIYTIIINPIKIKIETKILL